MPSAGVDPSLEAGPEPIAVIGMGLRFPGGISSPEQFWDFLMAGDEARTPVPEGRWDALAALSPAHRQAADRAIKYGSFLTDIAGFDAEFFGIAPREAELMDPQQRVTLEVAWEALEHAGVPATGLSGGDTGVFMGVCTDDYGRRMLENLPELEAWMGIGASLCGVANRVSYALDLRGPSVAIDTACSASLVAIHQACQALRAGESRLALAGGVMLMTSPAYLLVLEAAGALAPDGRSKAFDASADGYGRGEGCGVLVLKKLADALADGDTVHGVIRGSAVCQDGRTNGIMAPSQEAQENLLRRACANAGVEPSALDYIEAHGTGTALGDPIEAGALAAVIGAGRGAPVPIGSVKTNIGHLEAASGVAGVIKLILSMRHGLIPPTVTPTGPSPAIDWEAAGLKVVTEPTPWPRSAGPKLSGTGNYGYGGTIAHVIVEEPPRGAAPREADPAAEPPAVRLYPLSSASAAGVRANAAALADWLDRTPGAPLAPVGYTLAHHRAALDFRAAVLAGDRAELTARLRAVAAGHGSAGVGVGRVIRSGTTPGAVWVFSGHGAQWAGMGRELLATEPAMGRALKEVRDVFVRELGLDPVAAVASADHADYTDVAHAQAMIFAIQVGLARIWTERGLSPAAVIGHSVGEIAAAVAAGMLDLPDAARLVARRSRLLRRAAGTGAMAMVDLPFQQAAARLDPAGGVVAAIAAAPASTVISGPVAAVEQVLARWRAEGLTVRRVDSGVPFHSPAMEELAAALAVEAADITPRAPKVPVYTSALADPRSDALRDGSYWAVNLREPVLFHQAIQAAVDDGFRAFLEVSAHPVVQHSIAETLAASGVDSVVAHSLRRNKAEQASLAENLAVLHSHGVPVDWSVLQPAGGLIDLPTMVWQHRRFWLEAAPGALAQRSHDPDSHTLLGRHVPVQGITSVHLWQTQLQDANRPYPGRHAVLGAEVVPAAALLTTLLGAAGGAPLRDVRLRVPVSVAAPREVQVVRQDSMIRLSSQLAPAADERSWLTHASALTSAAVPRPRRRDVGVLHAAHPEVLDPGAVAELLRAIGVDGIGWPWRVDELRRGGGDLLATITADPDGGPSSRTWSSLFDAALSVAPVIFPGEPLLRMPERLRRAAVFQDPPAAALVHVRLVKDTGDRVEVDIDIRDLDGRAAAVLGGARFGAVPQELAAIAADVGHGAGEGEGDRSWRELTGPALHASVAESVLRIAAGEVRMAPEDLDPRRPLADVGVDSLMTVAIRLHLERRFQIPVPSTVLWDRPTVAALADYVTAEVQQRLTAPVREPA